MYGTHDDPYVYPGTHVLKNSENIKDFETLTAFELEAVNVRSKSNLPRGKFNTLHYRQIHKHLFQDVYEWAGDYRTVRIAKNGNWFCFPKHVDEQMKELFEVLKSNNYLKGFTSEEFTKKATKFLSDLNAIHPFRDGNGRAQLTFLSLLAENTGHIIRVEEVKPKSFLAAMIKSFMGDLDPLEAEISFLLKT